MPKVKPIPASEIHNTPAITPRKRHVINPKDKGTGMAVFNDASFDAKFSQPIGKKGESGRDTWANTALVLVERAKRAAQTYGKKDFNALYRLVLSAGIAYDKAWPTQQAPQGNNLIIQLFGSLGTATAKAILEPSHPQIIDITPIAVDPIALPTSDKPLDDTTLADSPLAKTT